MVIHLRLGWNGWKHPGAGGVSTRVVEVCESIGCALALQSMRSAKAVAANLDSNFLCVQNDKTGRPILSFKLSEP